MSERIGILAATFNPKVGILAGGHIHFIEVARRWPDASITVFAPASAKDSLAAHLPDADFVPIPGSSTGFARFDQLTRVVGALRVRRQLRSMDAILCSSHFAADVLPAVLAKPKRTAVILHHLVEPPWRRRGNVLSNTAGWLGQALSLTAAKVFIKRFVFLTEHMARLSGWATGDAALYITTNGVNRDGSAPDFSNRRDGLYFGRLDPTKRVGDAIAAWSLLPASCATHRLHIVGQGSDEYENVLRMQVKHLGLEDRVVFHGRVAEEEKWALLESAGVFVFPSAEEGFGIVVAEAMRAGLPCVTYDLPIFEELFTEGRRSVALGDVEGIARECAILLENEGSRVSIAQRAFEFSKRFSWECAADVERRALTFDSRA